MELLKSLHSKSPNLSDLNLEFHEIEDISPLLPLLSSFPHLQDLVLFGNRIEKLPKDMSSLKNLSKLDISNNMLDSISQVLPGLKSLPKLQELNITLNTQDEEDLLLSSLPHLTRLNDTDLLMHPVEYSGPESLTQDDLEKVAVIYDDIRSYAKDIDSSLDKRLAADFDELVKDIMGQLSEVLKKENNSFVTTTHMILAKFNMYKICQEKTALLAGRTNKKLGKIVKSLSDANHSVVDQLCKLMLESYEKFNEKHLGSSHELNRASNQVNVLLASIEKLETEIEKLKSEHKKLVLDFSEEKQEMTKELEYLQEENRKYLDTIIKHSKSNAGSVLHTSIYEEKPKQISQSLATRTLSLKQLKDLITEIYESKSKFDEKCVENKMPRETMEQHMYTFLNQKYGLRNLIIEWVAAIITGIKTYSAEDNDVAVFGKILRNECDEEFRFVQNQVKETVNELLKIQIKNKYPLKAANEINKILEDRVNGFVLEDEWTEVVKYMYNETDSQSILSNIWNCVNSKPCLSARNRNSREDLLKKDIKNSVIGYNEYLKLLLDFQLKAHEKFLQPFVRVFRNVVNSKNGVLNENDFITVCKQLELDESVIVKMLAVIDPHENQAITFSECVALLSTEMFPGKNIPILQELSMGN